MKRTYLNVLALMIGSSQAVKDWNDVFEYNVVRFAIYDDEWETETYDQYYVLCHHCVQGGGHYWQHPNFPPFTTYYTNLDGDDDIL